MDAALRVRSGKPPLCSCAVRACFYVVKICALFILYSLCAVPVFGPVHTGPFSSFQASRLAFDEQPDADFEQGLLQSFAQLTSDEEMKQVRKLVKPFLLCAVNAGVEW